MIDYKRIISDGWERSLQFWYTKEKQSFLTSHFKAEAQKAKRDEFIEIKDYFVCIQKVVDIGKDDIHSKHSTQIHSLCLITDDIENRIKNSTSIDEVSKLADDLQHHIEAMRKIGNDGVVNSAHTYTICTMPIKCLLYKDLEFIEEAIKQAEQELLSDNKNTDIPAETLKIPENILNWLQNTICDDGKPFIEKATLVSHTWDWVQNKQNARVLLTHENIRGKLTKAEVERQAPTLFFYSKEGRPLKLASNDPRNENRDTDKLRCFLDDLKKHDRLTG